MEEILDVMDGECSEQYEYFRTLAVLLASALVWGILGLIASGTP